MRALRWVGGALGTLLVFVLSVVGGVLVHANTPSARRLAAGEVNTILAPQFQGRIRVYRLGQLGLFGLSGADLTIEDPTGKPALVARGVRVRIATLDALRSALLGKRDPLTVRLSDVSIDTLDVRLDTDDKGQLDLVNAFAPRGPATPADPDARGFRLAISRIAWRHAWAHGLMAGAPPIDADVDELRGAFSYAPDALEGDVAQARVVARHIANGADVAGWLDAHVRQPSDPKVQIEAHVHWEGVAAGIEHSARASIADGRVDAVVDVPQTEPAKIRALWPGSPIDRPVEAQVEVHGPLVAVAVGVHGKVGGASLEVRGKVSIATDKTAKMTLDARNVDVHQLAASAPTSRVGLTGTVSADMKPDGALSGDVDLRFLGGKVGTNDVPAASIHGSGSLSTTRQVNATITVVVDEPGAPTHLDLRVFPKGTSSAVTFDLAAKSIDLDRVPELGHALRGSFGVFAKGELDVGAMTIDGRLRAKADGIVQGSTRVESASIEGRAEGPVAAPSVELAVRARGVLAGGLHFTSASVDARGKTTAAHVTSSIRGPDAPDMDASADVGIGHGVSVDSLRVALARRGQRALLTVRRVTAGGGDVRVDDGRLEGAGEPMMGTFAMTPGTLWVRAATKGLDLACVARLANLEKNLKGGTLAFDTDLRVHRQSAEGRMTLDVKQAALGTVKDVTGHIEVSLAGRKVAAKAHVEANGIGTVDLDAPEVELASGETMSAAAWRGAWGAIDIDANTDLAKATALFPADQLPISRARGQIHIKGHLARDDIHDFTPDVTLSVTTQNLELAAQTPTSRDIDGVVVFPPPAWHIEGIDVVVDGHIDGHTGVLMLSTQAHDAKGPLAQLDLGSQHFPYAEALHDSAGLPARLRTTSFDAHLVIPERPLGSVPAILKQSYVTGRLTADVKASGTMLAPKVDVTAAVHRADYTGNGGRGLPLDVDVVAHYDGVRGTASVKAHSAEHEMLDVEAQVDAALAQLLDTGGSETSLAWKASAKAHLTGFPMGSIAALDDKMVTGQLSGDVSLVDLHANAHADVALTIDALSVGSVTYKSANVHLTADGHVLDGTARIDQTDGFVETKAHAPASWGAAMVPALDRAQPLDFNLSAKNFRIAALLPFVDGELDELDGRLDAETHVQLDPTKNTARASGTIALSRGTVEAVAGGGELHDITANLKLAPDGTLTLEKLTAKGLTGQLQATGTAKLDGVTLQSAKAVIVIPKRSAIPLSASGTDIGNVDGRIEVTELTSEDGKAMDVKLEIPNLRVALPEGSSANPEELGAMAKVRIGAHRGDPQTFMLLPLDPAQPAATPHAKAGATKLTMEAHLADVEVVRGTEVKIDLDGRVNVVNRGGAAQVTGQIHLKHGGLLDVQGKKFTVEDGTVTLVGADPANPEVVVKASWTAPDGTVVYATFNGPLKTGKVTLSSEPTLPQQEIVELLLFGTADGTQAQTPSGTPANSAIGTAGGEAAQPLNHALGQLGLGAVTANIDTTQAANPRPEVEVQIAKDISVQLAVVLGQPPPGVNPDHTLLTVDWRFLTKWSLASTVGDAGTTIFDLLWQRRY